MHTPRLTPRKIYQVVDVKPRQSNEPSTSIELFYKSHRKFFLISITFLVFSLGVSLSLLACVAASQTDTKNTLDDFGPNVHVLETIERYEGCPPILNVLTKTMVLTNDSINFYLLDTNSTANYSVDIVVYIQDCQSHLASLDQQAICNGSTLLQNAHQSLDELCNYAYLAMNLVATSEHSTASDIVASSEYNESFFRADVDATTLSSFYKNQFLGLTEDIRARKKHMWSLTTCAFVITCLGVIGYLSFTYLSNYYEKQLFTEVHATKEKWLTSRSGTPRGVATGTDLSFLTNLDSRLETSSDGVITERKTTDKRHHRSSFVTSKRCLLIAACLAMSISVIGSITTLTYFAVRQAPEMTVLSDRHDIYLGLGQLGWAMNNAKELVTAAFFSKLHGNATYSDELLNEFDKASSFADENMHFLDDWSEFCMFPPATYWQATQQYNVLARNCTVSDPICSVDVFGFMLLNTTWDTTRRLAMHCIDFVNGAEQNLISNSEKTTSYAANVVVFGLAIGLGVSFCVVGFMFYAVKRVVNLLSTCAGTVEWDIDQIMNDKQARNFLLEMMQSRMAAEPLLFYIAVENVRENNQHHNGEQLEKVINDFIRAGSPNEINVADSEKQEIIKYYERKEYRHCWHELRQAKKHVSHLIASNELHTFLRYGPFVSYAELKNREVMQTISALRAGLG